MQKEDSLAPLARGNASSLAPAANAAPVPAKSGRSRRFAGRQVEPTQHLLTFELQQNWFALPVQTAHKVIAIDHLYGNAPNSVAGFILHQNQEIPVLDIEQRVLGQHQKMPLDAPDASPTAPKFLLIIQNLDNEFVGLPLHVPPILRRIPLSAFSPLSSTYLNEGNIRCVSAIIIPSQEDPPLFLLNLNQLMQSQATLPPGAGYES